MIWVQLFLLLGVDLGACFGGLKTDLFKHFLGLGAVLGASGGVDEIVNLFSSCSKDIFS